MCCIMKHMGIVSSMKQVKAARVCGIDASTNSLAFAVLENGKPVHCGEIKFVGKTVFERIRDAQRKTRALVESGVLRADYVGIESAVMVRNIQTAISLAYIYGAIIGELMVHNPEVHQVAPISWQSGIGVPNLTKAEKEALRTDFPNRSLTWYQNKGRQIRKQRILDRARTHFDIPDDSDNIGDAVGIAMHIDKTLTRR
jgi:Holliday junction resolvasome RuvABC endonuclease subunit